MPAPSPIWPSRLDHLRIDSDDPELLSSFYAAALRMSRTPLADETLLLQGSGRRLVFGRGRRGDRPYHGFRVETPGQLAELRDFAAAQGLVLEKSPSALFEPDAVALRDPDGWLSVFGIPRDDLPAAPEDSGGPAARLQHVVVASNDLTAMCDFYEHKLGFVASDFCEAEPGKSETRRAAFYRSDPEHHSFAIFAAGEVRADHHSYETSCWNDIRDWADHLAELRIQIWWGPGRHGPGNNLFFMIKDPHGQPLEFSAEIESLSREAEAGTWPMEERALNLWGPGWIRE